MNTDNEFMQITENDLTFAKTFETFVNGNMRSAKKTALAMTTAHRYLQEKMFDVVLAFIRQLAINFHKGLFDDRNKWACNLSAIIYDYLIDNRKIYDNEYKNQTTK